RFATGTAVPQDRFAQIELRRRAERMGDALQTCFRTRRSPEFVQVPAVYALHFTRQLLHAGHSSAERSLELEQVARNTGGPQRRDQVTGRCPPAAGVQRFLERGSIARGPPFGGLAGERDGKPLLQKRRPFPTEGGIRNVGNFVLANRLWAVDGATVHATVRRRRAGRYR